MSINHQALNAALTSLAQSHNAIKKVFPVKKYYINIDEPPEETIEQKLAAAERRVHNFIDAICEREHIKNQFTYEVLMIMPYYWKQYEVDKKRFDEEEKIADQIKQLIYL